MATQKNARGPEISSIDVFSYSSRFTKFLKEELFNYEYNHHVELERKHKDRINSSGVSQISEIIKSVVRSKKNNSRVSAQFGSHDIKFDGLTPKGF
jgi:hypothetical protein